MGGLLSALQNAGNALDVFEQAIGVVQSNVANSSTADYVTQTLTLNAASFQPNNQLYGGVQAGPIEDSRSIYAEQAVWTESELLGTATQQSASLNSLQSAFPVSGTTGIPAALSALYSAFSAWSTTPDGTSARQQVISAASQVAQAFNQTSNNIDQLRSRTDSQLQTTVAQINQLTSNIAQINQQRQNGSTKDAGLDAQLYSNLEQLANLANITVQTEGDGAVTVLLGGQTPVVIGSTQEQLTVTYLGTAGAPNPDASPAAQITTTNGQDVSQIVNSGVLAALVQFRDSTISSLVGDGTQQGSLNQLAQTVADRINALLTGGQVSSGATPVPGTPLFSYLPGSATTVAATLSLSAGITGSQLAAIDPGPPEVANGIADQLAQLSAPQNLSDTINGVSYTDFYGSLAASIGNQAATAASSQSAQAQLVAQAQNAREQISGVSLNEQATKLLQFQQAYQASSQVVSIINQTLESFFTSLQNS